MRSSTTAHSQPNTSNRFFKHDLSSRAVELHLDRIGNNRRVPSCGISGCIYSFKHEKRTAALLSILFIMPMWMNMLLRTLAWKIILYDDGIVATVLSWFGATDVQLIYTPGAVLIATIYDFLPFMILPIYTTLIKIDRSHIEAAHDLGANGLNTFLRVVLPQSIPGIISGITMVFVPAMSTFAVSTMLGGKKSCCSVS